MEQQRSGKEIIILIVAPIVIVAVVLVVIASALNGFLSRFSRDSLQAIAVLLVFAIPLTLGIGVLLGYAWHAARDRRVPLLPPAPNVIERYPVRATPEPGSYESAALPLSDDDSEKILALLKGET